MLLPLFSNVRYTPLNEKPWSNRRTWVSVLKYASIVFSTALLVFAALHVSGIKRFSLSKYNGDNASPDETDPAAVEKPDPPSPPAADEPLLGEVRGPDTIVVPQIPQNFTTVGMVFFGRKSRVEILDCYLKVQYNPSGNQSLKAC